MKENIINYVKYCLGYIKLTKRRCLGQSESIKLSKEQLNLLNVIKNDLETELSSEQNRGLIQLSTFYKYDPIDIPEISTDIYDREKKLANKIEDIYNEHRNDPYTKQLFLQFGCFEIELPIESEHNESLEDENLATQKKIEQYRLFSLPITIEKKIEKGIGKYFLNPSDLEIQVNIGMLETALGEDLYFQIVKKIGEMEILGKFTLPIITTNALQEVWQMIKAQLRHKNAKFNEQSFDLETLHLLLGPQSNYFLSEDLVKLSRLQEKDFNGTALSCLTQNHELNIKSPIPHEKQLYFPFPYDKSQLETLSLIKNKGSIIQGPPGTGKSTTIANILCHLAAQGNRVLFVSQKAQALKVVKDKLKQLKIRYLFSYIPNLSSTQLDKTDEIDGIAPQLSALSSYIEELERKPDARERIARSKIFKASSKEQIVENLEQLRHDFNQSIKTQQEYCTLESMIPNLKEYDVKIENEHKFISNASNESFKELVYLHDDIEIQIKTVKKCEAKKQSNWELFDNKLVIAFSKANNKLSNEISKIVAQFDIMYPLLKRYDDNILTIKNYIKKYDQILNQSKYVIQKQLLDDKFSCSTKPIAPYLNDIILLKDDVIQTISNRQNFLFRRLNNALRSMRHKKTLSRIPIELREYIDDCLDQNILQSAIVTQMEFMVHYFSRMDQHQKLQTNEKQKQLILCDLTKQAKNALPDAVMHVVQNALSVETMVYDEVKGFFVDLIQYAQYKEEHKKLESLISKKNEALSTFGTSKEAFAVIVMLHQKYNDFDVIKNKILKLRSVKHDMNNIQKIHANYDNEQFDISALKQEHDKAITSYIQNLIDENLLRTWQADLLIRQVVRKLAGAFSKSKKAFKTFDNLRKTPEHFKNILDIIPIWIMELDDASRIIPLEPQLFDYVILDEASQCNIAYALPVMHRSNRVLFVGDSEQMRDSTVMFKSNSSFDELAQRFHITEEKRIKSTGTSVQSVLDIAHNRGFIEKVLRSHYRSSLELIGFCNEHFYKPKGKQLAVVNNNCLTYKDTNRTMIIHNIQSDWVNEKDDHINVAEAEYVLNLFKELRAEDKYQNKSIGILSFFTSQTLYIRKLLEQAGFSEVTHNYKVSNIDGIQGDEKDIVIYSFVIRKQDQKNKYIPLTGESGDINASINAGRVNVAFSRAKQQVHCCLSMPIDQIPENIWIKKYLQYVQKHGEAKHNRTELKPFDSYFEETFYNALSQQLSTDYIIQNQVESCGFKIDFVVTNTKTGKKLAIECDGPCHFENELDEAFGVYVEHDEERQRVLESAQWRFYRVKYSNWIDRDFDRDNVINNIVQLLN